MRRTGHSTARGLSALGTLLLAGALLAGCPRETRRFEVPPARQAAPLVRLSTLQPGKPIPEAALSGPYDGNAWAIAEGQQLYHQYNCAGCHFEGGGGIGPALMDAKWIYGSEPRNVHDTIVAGRPNGMPSYGGHVPDDQVWKLVAYVRSLSGLGSKAARPGRSDHLEARPSAQATPPQEPVGDRAEHLQ